MDAKTERDQIEDAAYPFESAYPAELARRERALIDARRKAVFGNSPQAGGGEPPGDEHVGVGLSGGGIRSATFCLGVFQALAREKLIRRIDYLSTVSGGGYFGTFFGRLFTRPAVSSVADVEDVLTRKKEPGVVRHLREHGRYLAPNGAGDALLAAAVGLRNWVAVVTLPLVAALALFFLMHAANDGYARWESAPLHDAGLGLWFSAAVATFAVWAAPVGLAYWLIGITRDWASTRRRTAAIAAVILLVATFVASTAKILAYEEIWRDAPLWLFAAATPGGGLIVAWLAWRIRPAASSATQSVEFRDARRRLTSSLADALTWTVSLALLGLVDLAAEETFARLDAGDALFTVGTGTGLGGAIALVRPLLARLKGPGRPSIPVSVAAGIAAVIVGGSLLVATDVAAHFIVHSGGENSAFVALGGFGISAVLSMWFGSNVVFVNRSTLHGLYSARITRAYLGASNPHRAKKNVSIGDVCDGDDARPADYWRRDDLDLKATAPPIGDSGRSPFGVGAPLHFINVTINETFDGASRIQQRDRKGVGMAVGPHGLSVGVKHHALMDWNDVQGARSEAEAIRPIVSADDRTASPVRVQATRTEDVGAQVDAKVFPPNDGGFRVFDERLKNPEGLSLGYWVGASGAAFSTGLGSRTSWGTSLLSGLANVRLGYWWRSGVYRGGRDSASAKAAHPLLAVRVLTDLGFRLFETQTYLLSEFMARFPGTAWRRWYLSDGGHFENMAGYELVRRRLKRIVIVDAEEDADYSFEGLANLVRKARVDFGAEIRFLDEPTLDRLLPSDIRPHVGTLDQLRRAEWRKRPVNPPSKGVEAPSPGAADQRENSLASSALGRVTYADGTRGLLVYLKPALTGDEPADVVQYHANHAAFPHESTADQFFDEAQWESYRALGEHVAGKVFALPADGEQAARFRPRRVFM